MRRLMRHLSPSMIVALLALTVALGGTAVAATLINGKNIKNGTVVGKKLKKNTVTGKQIKESSLGRVPSATKAVNADKAASATNAATAGSAATAANADKLGGLAPTAFVQGKGGSVSASVNTASSSSNQPILEIPGIGVVRADCAANGIDATLEFLNTSGTSLVVIGTSVQNFDEPTPDVVSTTPNSSGLANNSFTTIQTRAVGQSIVQAWSSSANKNATFVVSNVFCLFNASATSNQ